MVYRYFIFLLCFFCMSSCILRKHIVNDEASAIKIAEETLLSSMDKDELESLKPFRAILRHNEIWEVFPRDIAEFSGLLPIVYIKKKNGRVINVSEGGDVPKEAMPVK